MTSGVAARRLAVLLAATLLGACNGGTPAPPPAVEHPAIAAAALTAPRLPPDTALARVDGEVITAADLDAAINAVPGPERLEYTSPEPLREMVQSLADRKLMAQAARAAGLDRDPPLAEAALAEAWLERELGTVAAPAEAEITAYYREHAAEFTAPASVFVTRIVTATEAAAAPVRAALARGASVDEARAAAADHVISADRLWLQDAPKKPELVAIALALQPGEVSAAIPVATGFAVLRAEESAAARLRPIAEVQAGIAANLSDARRQEATALLYERLRAGAQIVVDDAALTSYSAPPSEPSASPPGVP